MLDALFVLAQAGDWDHHTDWGDGWWIVMMVGMLVFWGAIAVAAIWGIRAFTGARRTPDAGGTEESALAVLDRSLAEGRISVEDYEQRRRVLTRPPADARAEDDR